MEKQENRNYLHQQETNSLEPVSTLPVSVSTQVYLYTAWQYVFVILSALGLFVLQCGLRKIPAFIAAGGGESLKLADR